jgi:subtilase family serine protease
MDAYQTPHLREDVAAFNNIFNLPPLSLRILAPYGVAAWKASDKSQVAWSSETTLDVEWAHAIAPGASITLVEAKSEDDIDLLKALSYAVKNDLGDIISMSFGEAENCMKPQLVRPWHKVLKAAFKKKITVFAATGDNGAAQPSCDGNSWQHAISAPASDPLVTSVGGTTLDADAVTGKYNYEVAWNEPAKKGATGGGFSEVVKQPFYQTPIPATITSSGIAYRGIPDVAYNSSVLGGVITMWSDGPKGLGGVYSFGGTSAGTPQWAAIIALADEYSSRRIGFINAALYWIGKTPDLYRSSFHDTSSGTNTITLSDTKGPKITIQGYNAQQNWDPTTGLGSPIVSELVPLLAKFTLSSGVDLWNYKKK